MEKESNIFHSIQRFSSSALSPLQSTEYISLANKNSIRILISRTTTASQSTERVNLEQSTEASHLISQHSYQCRCNEIQLYRRFESSSSDSISSHIYLSCWLVSLALQQSCCSPFRRLCSPSEPRFVASWQLGRPTCCSSISISGGRSSA